MLNVLKECALPYQTCCITLYKTPQKSICDVKSYSWCTVLYSGAVWGEEEHTHTHTHLFKIPLSQKVRDIFNITKHLGIHLAKMRCSGCGREKTAHIRTSGLSMSPSLAARALNTAKSMMPAHPLSLTKQQSQSIVPDPSVTNSYIHIDTPGNKAPKERGIEGWTREMEGYISPSLFCFLFGGVLVIRASPP